MFFACFSMEREFLPHEAVRNMMNVIGPAHWHSFNAEEESRLRRRRRWKRRRKLRRMLGRRRRLVLPKLVRYPWPELVSSSSESLPELIDSEG